MRVKLLNLSRDREEYVYSLFGNFRKVIVIWRKDKRKSILRNKEGMID